eukprot:13279427-Alexandrium_andersonii.AAC.1
MPWGDPACPAQMFIAVEILVGHCSRAMAGIHGGAVLARPRTNGWSISLLARPQNDGRRSRRAGFVQQPGGSNRRAGPGLQPRVTQGPQAIAATALPIAVARSLLLHNPLSAVACRKGEAGGAGGR